MSHNEKRTTWIKEGLISQGVGIIYGVTVVASAHPFDTIKTKMQAVKGFENRGMFKTAVEIIKVDGIRGLYRGCIPPLWGSGVYRSVQFSAFEATYTALDNDFGRTQIPLTKGTEYRVVLAGAMSGTVRSLIETPLEYAKTQRQIGKSWELKRTYTGMKITWMRASVLMSFYFIYLDSFRRNFDEFFRSNVFGPFIASGVASTAAWWMCWPLELVKCQIQAGYLDKNMSIIQRLKFIAKERGGLIGLYRGIAPGSIRSFIGNGTGMVVMQWAQKQVTSRGWRD